VPPRPSPCLLQESKDQLLSSQANDNSSKMAEYQRLMAEHNARMQDCTSQSST
jgi:hypothetical protein